jgi:hypothetical protein
MSVMADAQIGGGTYIQGAGLVKYNILNGLITGSANFEFVTGEKCTIKTYIITSDLNIIKEISPYNNASNVARDKQINIIVQYVAVNQKCNIKMIDAAGNEQTIYNVMLVGSYASTPNKLKGILASVTSLSLTPNSNNTYIKTGTKTGARGVKINVGTHKKLHDENKLYTVEATLYFTDGSKTANNLWTKVGDFSKRTEFTFKTNTSYKKDGNYH